MKDDSTNKSPPRSSASAISSPTHIDLVNTWIALDELNRRLGSKETFEIEPPHRDLTANDAAAIASSFHTWCNWEHNHRNHTLTPRRPQPHRPTESRLREYVRGYRNELEPRTADTAPIRLRSAE